MAHRLVITLADDGQIGVEGPIQNKVLTYGMLEAARDAVQAYNEREQTRIAVPQMRPPRGMDPFKTNGG